MNKFVLSVGILAVLVGCSDDDKASTGGAETVTWVGTITDGTTTDAIDGAEVCATDPDFGCATTDAMGAYSLPGMPANTDVTFKVSASGYIPSLIRGDTSAGSGPDGANGSVFTQAFFEGALAPEGVTLDLSKGLVGVGTNDATADTVARGYSIAISPASGDGPFYFGLAGVVPGATATDAAGTAVFANVDPGTVNVSTTGPMGCTAALNVASNEDNTYPVPVEAGALGITLLNCPDGGPQGGAGGTGGTGGAGGMGGAGGSN